MDINLLINDSVSCLDQCEALLNMISEEAYVEQTQVSATIITGAIRWINSSAYSAGSPTGQLIMMRASVTSLLKPIWRPPGWSPSR